MGRNDDASLDAYRRRRDPEGTTEPFGRSSAGAEGATRQGRFVVHLHDATRRHYDLRLEVGGALKSFAVPKGPSLHPKDKRLAVQTEDHPLEYLEFEDVIPEGNYGAGAMIAWDRGLVTYPDGTAEQGLDAGKLDFELHGYKLRGRFALVRTDMRKRGGRKRSAQESSAERGTPDKPQWLLLKKQDAFSRTDRDLTEEQPWSVLSGLTVEERADAREVAARLDVRAQERGAPEGEVDAHRITPMLCASDDTTLQAEGWLYELKLDGVRILADRRDDDVTLLYRTRRPATAAYPEVVDALRTMASRRFVLDGEIVAFDEHGLPSFHRLARRIHAQRPLDVRHAARAVPVVYVVFDLLALGDRDLRGLPLAQRKALLAELVRGPGPVRLLDHLEDDGRPLYELCAQQGLEGLVAKRADSPYRAGERSGDWQKIKRERDAEFVVIGYTRGERSRSRLGALDVASYDEGGTLVVRGKVGSGLDAEAITTLRDRLAPLHTDTCAAEGELERAPRGRAFVRPELVVRVRFTGWTDDGRLRHPVFLGLREDVAPEDCTASPRRADDAVLGLTEPTSRPEGRTRVAGRRGVQLTNQDKIFWPDDGVTKGDLCSYYETMADVILPYLRDRPVVLVRYPEGIESKSFYQWNLPEGTPAWVRSMPLTRSEEGRSGSRARQDASRRGTTHDEPKTVQTFLVDDLDTLLYIANLGAIPIHVLAARASSLSCCDFVTIDLDVGEATLQDAVRLARSLGELLDEIGLEGYPKTSGRSGLHVLVPLGPGIGFDTAQTLAQLLGRLVVVRHPDIATMERVKNKRGMRVYVDTGQTGPTRTIVAPWSVRAAPRAPVSTPLLWDEVAFALDPRRFTMQTMPERVATYGDPMRPMLDATPDIHAAVERLGARLGR